MQATRLEIPTSVLQQFAQAASLDTSLLNDLRAAVVELNDRLQYRSNVLGGACVTLHSGYNVMLENLDRIQQGMDAHNRVLANLVQENQSLKHQLEETRECLERVQVEASQARLGPVQWKAQIEAHIVNIQSELSGHLDEVRALSQNTASRLGPLEEAARRGTSTKDSDVHARLTDLASITEGVRNQMGAMESRQEALIGDISSIRQEFQAVTEQQDSLHQEVMQLQTLCEHFWIADAEEQGLPGDDAEVNAYEQEWWGMPAGCGYEDTGAVEDVAATAVPVSNINPGVNQGPIGGLQGHAGSNQPPPGLSAEDGVAAAAPAKAVDQSDENIHHGRWKLLQEVPELNLGSGEPWELGMRLRTWTKQVEAVAGTIAPSFSDYVKSQFQLAEHRHQNRMVGLADYRDSDPLPKVRVEDTEKENRLVLLLIRCLPAELKQSVMEKHGEASKGKGKGKGGGKTTAAAEKPCAALSAVVADWEMQAKPKAAASADSSSGNTLVGAKASSVTMTAGSVVAMAVGEDSFSSSGDSSLDDEDLQSMAGEASTPEWSDVEQGNVPSEDESEEEPRDPMTFQLRNAPLWVLNLSPAEYLQWSTPGGIMDRAQNDFHEQRNPNSIVWPVWWTIAFDHLDTNADGVIQVTEDVVMLQCNLATVRCEDEVCRQVFVVWICEEETGQERMLAVNRMWQRPVVYRHDGDGERAQLISATPGATRHNQWTAISATPGATRHNQWTATSSWEPPIWSLGDGVPSAKAPTVAMPPPLQRPQAKAKATATASFSITPRRPPAARAPAERPGRLLEAHAAQAESRGMKCSTETLVLADSGANELIRPAGDAAPSRSTKVSLTLADGNLTFAWKTRDGELAIPGDSSSWIAPVGKIVELGYRFEWDPITGAQLSREGDVFHMQVENGLPYLTWSDFTIIRRQLSQAYKARRRFHGAQAQSDTALKSVTMEELIDCEMGNLCYDMGGEQQQKPGEDFAERLLRKKQLTYDDLLDALSKAALEPQRKRRTCVMSEDAKVSSWLFGAYGGATPGVTQRTADRPMLTRLVNKFMSQQLPGMTWSSFTVSYNVAFAPHRDKGNEPGTQNIFVVASDKSMCTGGELWIENPDGEHVRRVSEKQSLRGIVMPTLRNPVVFMPHRWHGTAPWSGNRIALTFFTTRGTDAFSQEERARLRDLGFWCKPSPEAAASEEAHRHPTTASASLDSTSVLQDPEFPDPATTRVSGTEVTEGIQDAGEFRGGFQGRVAEIDGASSCSLDYEPSELGGIEMSGQRAPTAPPLLEAEEDTSSAKEDPFFYAHKKEPEHTAADYGSRGTLKPHRRLKAEDVAQGCLSIDLTGPFKVGLGGYRYALVANFNPVNATPLYFMRPLRRRLREEVVAATFDIIAQVHSMAGCRPEVVRLHSDNAAEFVSKTMCDEAAKKGLYKTTSVPYEHASNGRAERAIRYLKEKATRYILEASAPPEIWPYALAEAALVQRAEVTGARCMKGQPVPWTTVAITKHGAEPFTSKTETARFLCRDEHTASGALVLVKRNGQNVIVRSRLPAIIPAEQKTWRTHITPLGDMVWVSNCGDVHDADALRDIGQDLGLVTYEESTFPASGDRCFLSGSVGSAHANTLKSNPRPDHAGKYHLLSYEEENAGNEIEASLLEASVAPAQAETVDLKGFFQGSRQKEWRESLMAEYAKMDGVLREVPRSKLREYLKLSPEAKLPREIPSKVVPTLKPSDDERANADGFMEKSRICACGNFEEATDNNGEPWTSSNIPPEIVRCFVSLAAKVDSWTLGGLDVEAAFLNADISGDPVIITPPKIMRDLEIIAEGTVWVAERNIYGLRRGPTEWEKERDTKLDDADLPPGEGDKLGTLHLVPLKLAAGLWKVTDDAGVTRGACCAYVDDGLIVGDIEVVRRVTALIRSFWAIKGQGVLVRPGAQVDGPLKIDGDFTLKPVTSMRFLGAEISVNETGLSIGQSKYVAQELRCRGWLSLKGSESLPVPDEGLKGAEPRTERFEETKRLAQKECGTLMWLALRSRPDIAACLGIAATQITSRPGESLRLCKGIWRYLRATWDQTLSYSFAEAGENPAPTPEPHEGPHKWIFRIVTDASLAPGGSRSRSGVALFLGEHLLYWKSQRQALVAWSATEAEVEATAIGFQDGLKLHAVISELVDGAVPIRAYGDNAGAIQLLTKERFHEQAMRTRHFAIRVAYLRDLACRHAVKILHKGTNDLEADGLTKVLGRAKLATARRQLHIM
ncbi:Retrovirus-related Pol polyprotein from transposon TNT 1-94 [Symbiodinium microadriaticum]|uniref:Retrovirus-related Pol polyprotein from transposon TNT 1-94 n=1 Tax=Symbiodinium microadriaticum TaxID=2951 RepID=A0A1Q9CSR3_SYMMI|nr:Retrovirus-related Pol polyprotein from transposon TNT 1-94 [Symbiodinium microadriaticum]